MMMLRRPCIALLLLLPVGIGTLTANRACAADGDPLALRCWPAGAVSLETHSGQTIEVSSAWNSGGQGLQVTVDGVSLFVGQAEDIAKLELRPDQSLQSADVLVLIVSDSETLGAAMDKLESQAAQRMVVFAPSEPLPAGGSERLVQSLGAGRKLRIVEHNTLAVSKTAIEPMAILASINAMILINIDRPGNVRGRGVGLFLHAANRRALVTAAGQQGCDQRQGLCETIHGDSSFEFSGISSTQFCKSDTCDKSTHRAMDLTKLLDKIA